jgi:hypothetical protein
MRIQKECNSLSGAWPVELTVAVSLVTVPLVVLLMTVVVVLTTTDCCCCSSFSVVAVVTIVLEADDLSSETRLSSAADVLLQNVNKTGEMEKIPH